MTYLEPCQTSVMQLFLKKLAALIEKKKSAAFTRYIYTRKLHHSKITLIVLKENISEGRDTYNNIR